MFKIARNAALSLFLALALSLGCGEVESVLIVTINHDTLPADNQSETTVTVRAWFRDEPVKDGTRINLSTSAGVFKDRSRKETSLTTTGGEASTIWVAPYTDESNELFEGDVTFIASYTDPYKIAQEARVILQMVAPPPIEGSSFRFWCTAKNVMRPTGTEPIRVPCLVEAKDINGRDVVVDDVRFGFLCEAGRIEFDRDGNPEWVLSPGELPKQVDPLGDPSTGEPRWFDQTAGITRNPRDGIATLIVHTHGRPSGQVDLLHGEPYVDENDDGQWNPGEPYFDANGNGQYDGPTGSTDARRIWRWTKMMITGPISETGPESAEGLQLWDTGEVARQNIQLDRGMDISIGLILVDENLNPVAAHPTTSPDTVRVDATPSGILAPSQQSLAVDATGLTFDNLTGQVVAGSSRTGYLQGSLTYRFRVENHLAPSYEGDPVPWRITKVEVRRIPYPGTTRTVSATMDGHELPRGTMY